MVQPVDYTIDVQNPFLAALQGFQTGQNIALKRRQMQMLAAEEQRKKDEANRFMTDVAEFDALENKTASDVIRLMNRNPNYTNQIKNSWAVQSQDKQRNDILSAQQVLSATESGNPQAAVQSLTDMAAAYRNKGDEAYAKSIDGIINDLNTNPEKAKRNASLFMASVVGPDALIKMYQGFAGKPTEFQKTGMVMVRDEDTKTFKMLVGSYDKATGDLSISEGTLPKNYTVVSATGETPQQMRERKVITQGETTAVQEAVKMGTKYAERSQTISENIIGLDKAIGIIEEGMAKDANLGLGFIKSKLPKFDPYAIKMQQAAQELGLGVVSSVTFGALSESELKIAMSTAMPSTLGPKEALQWLKDKRSAQTKLKNEMDKAAAFIGSQRDDGKFNTVADWKKMQMGQKPEEIPTVTTQEQYDALPQGAIFIEDGKRYRKP